MQRVLFFSLLYQASHEALWHKHTWEHLGTVPPAHLHTPVPNDQFCPHSSSVSRGVRDGVSTWGALLWGVAGSEISTPYLTATPRLASFFALLFFSCLSLSTLTTEAVEKQPASPWLLPRRKPPLSILNTRILTSLFPRRRREEGVPVGGKKLS